MNGFQKEILVLVANNNQDLKSYKTNIHKRGLGVKKFYAFSKTRTVIGKEILKISRIT